MKKVIYIFAAALIFLAVFSFPCLCVQKNDETLSDTEEQLFGIIDDETKDILESFGLDSLDYSKIYSFSFSNISEFFSTTLKDKAQETIKAFLLLSGALMVLCALRAISGTSGIADSAELICTMIMILFTTQKISPVINAILAVFDVSSKFLLSYIPIFAGLVAFGGNPSGALTYNTLALAFAQGISAFSKNFALPVVGGFYCLSISFSLSGNVSLSRFVNAFNRISSVTLGFISSLFAGLLCVRGIMSVSIDSVGSKSVRFLVSSMIPVVGSAISEAYSALLGSIGLIKGSVAIVGIVVCIVINLPAIVFALLYYGMLNIVSFFAEAAAFSKVSQITKAFASGIRFLLLLLVFEMFILIISTGLMLAFKAS